VALYIALHSALRIEALHLEAPYKALHDGSAYDGSILFSLVGVEKPRTGHFYPYRLRYFMHFLLDKDILCSLIRIIQNHPGVDKEKRKAKRKERKERLKMPK